MTSTPTFDPGFSTPRMTEVFSAASTLSAILEFEAALAGALGDVGIAPTEEAGAVAAACHEPLPEPEALLAGTWEAGTPLIAIKAGIESRLEGASKRWVHYGATSQDAIDTGRMIQAKRGLEILEGASVSVARQLRSLMVEHRDQPHMARTFLQDAVPTSFGARVAGWLSPTLERIVELRDAGAALRAQLGGPSGDLGVYGESSTELTRALASRVGLIAPPVPWHGDRSPIWSLARTVEATALTMAKIATDLALLAQSSVAEVSTRPGGSSSMPGKRNPIDAVRVVAAASACSGFASMLTTAPTIQLDRGVGGWHTEWLAIPMLFQTGAASMEAMEMCLSALRVDTVRMGAAAGGVTVADTGLVDVILERCEQVGLGP